MNSNKELNIDLHPPRMPKYDSNIINGSYFAILSSWIEKKNHFYYNERNIPYNFNLLYRAKKNNLQSAKVGYSNNNKYSIGFFSDHGVVFGTDLYFYEGNWHSYRDDTHSYPKIGIPGKIFEVDDFEIFQVVKK
ncbi:unnamed protein product [Rhizophagus irregularis]|nr:unnamed protein product [Rhizophagus irregularis]